MLFLQLGLGFCLLVAGGELLVRGSVALAERAGVSALLIGLTLVGFGSSMPELVTSARAALIGSPGIALGNIVGSNIANILLILGVAGLIMPIRPTRRSLIRDGSVVLIAALLAAGLALTDSFGRVAGAALIIGLLAYIVLAYLTERTPAQAGGAAAAPDGPGIAVALALAIGGLVLIILGGGFLVDGAVGLALMLNVSESVVGLTIVAVGTSLPELATSVIAAIRRKPEIALGNILGSNIYNILGIGGATALIAPIATPPGMASLDFPIMIGASVLLLAFLATDMRLARWEAGVLLALYAGYVGLTWA